MVSKSFNKLLYVREELNGLSVYDQAKDYISFYEGLNFSQVETIDDIVEARSFFEKNSDKLSENLNFHAPLKVNWLVSGKCNLDCVYCFADDKFGISDKNANIDEVINSIQAINPLVLGLSGGEPTLSADLSRIIKKTSEHCAIVLDTNGAVDISEDLRTLIKESNVHVRISLDSIDPQMIRALRPRKYGREDYLSLVLKNIEIFADANLTVHTVVTQKNIHVLHELGENLVALGVRRWHLYGVSKSKKCRSFYHELKVSEHELYTEYNKLIEDFSGKLKISCYFDEANFENDMIIMLDSAGRFFVDSTESGVRYIGTNPHRPTYEEIKAVVNTERHCKAYVTLALRDKQPPRSITEIASS